MKIHYYYNDILDMCTNNHLTADDVFMKLKEKYPSVGISTVYRNLENLVKKGELKKITNIGKKAYFEKNKGFHVHIFDKTTGKIMDVEAKDFNINLPKDFKPDEMELIVTGKFLK